ncbi:MAG: hypothetical protein WCQ95_00845 [Bacteroidota bacterium]
MRLRKLIFSFVRYSVDKLIVFSRSVVDKMTGNPNFTTPSPKLVDVTAAIDDVEDKAALAQGGSKLDHSNLKNSKKSLLELLRKLAKYVDVTADDDEGIIISSGFELSKEPEASQRDDFWILAGMSPGEFLIGCVAYPKAVSYLWQVSADDKLPVSDSAWLFAGVSKQRKTYLSGTPDTKRWFRVRPLTKAGLMPASKPILYGIR